jgi:general secretion pathway protein L
MAQRILGLDLGATAVKGVLLESSYRSWTVVDSAAAPLVPAAEAVAVGEAPGPADRLAAAVSALTGGRGWKFDAAVVAFPGAAVSSHLVTLPFTDPRRLAEAVGFEVEGQIPFELAEVAWDWQVLGQGGGGSDLLVAVVRRAELSALLSTLAGSAVDPRAVVPAGVALAALLASGAVAPPEGAEADGPGADAILDLGWERTSLAIASAAGGLEAARTFPFGGAHLARALARELTSPERGLALSERDAAAILSAESRGETLPPSLAEAARDPRAAEAVRRALVPLLRELRASLRAWRTRAGARPLRRLLLAGEVGRLPGLAELLGPEVGGPVAVLELSGPAAALSGPAGSGLALALALALHGHLGARASRLNLRRGDLAFTRDFEHVKGKVARLAGWTALVVLLGLAATAVQAFALSRREAAVNKALCEAQQKLLGKCYDDFEQAQAVLRGRGTPGASLPRLTAVDVLAELSVRVPESVPVRLDRIEVTREKLHLQGTTEAAENVDRIVGALRGSRCFGDARSGGARRRGQDQKFEFSVDSGLTCLEGGGEEPGKGGP